MNQAEKRRKKLLEQTRNLYSDYRNVPAIHPRYKVMYRQLYKDEYEVKTGSFGIRIGICILLFILYIGMGYKEMTIYGVDNMQVVEKIMQNIPYRLY